MGTSINSKSWESTGNLTIKYAEEAQELPVDVQRILHLQDRFENRDPAEPLTSHQFTNQSDEVLAKKLFDVMLDEKSSSQVEIEFTIDPPQATTTVWWNDLTGHIDALPQAAMDDSELGLSPEIEKLLCALSQLAPHHKFMVKGVDVK